MGGRAGSATGCGLIGRVRRASFARVYDLQTNDRTNLIFQALRPFPPAWSGTAFGCALPRPQPGRMKLHSLERQAASCSTPGIWPDAPDRARCSAPPPDLSWLIGGRAPPPASRLALLDPRQRGDTGRQALAGRALRRHLAARPASSEGFDVAGDRRAGRRRALAPRDPGQRRPDARDLTGRTASPRSPGWAPRGRAGRRQRHRTDPPGRRGRRADRRPVLRGLRSRPLRAPRAGDGPASARPRPILTVDTVWTRQALRPDNASLFSRRLEEAPLWSYIRAGGLRALAIGVPRLKQPKSHSLFAAPCPRRRPRTALASMMTSASPAFC